MACRSRASASRWPHQPSTASEARGTRSGSSWRHARDRPRLKRSGAPGVLDASADPGPATLLEHIRSRRTPSSTTVTLIGNGLLVPSTVAESEDAPRRLVLDFPDVTAKSSGAIAVNSALVSKVRVAVHSRQPLVTRVVMELAPESDVSRRAERTRRARPGCRLRAPRRLSRPRPPDARRRRRAPAGRRPDHPRAGDEECRGHRSTRSHRGPPAASRRRRSRKKPGRGPIVRGPVVTGRRQPCSSAGEAAGCEPAGQAHRRGSGPAFSGASCGAPTVTGSGDSGADTRAAGAGYVQALHRPPDQPRLPGRRPARGAARLFRHQRPEHGHRPGRAGHGRHHPERGAVGPGARRHPARQSTRLHRRRHHRPHRPPRHAAQGTGLAPGAGEVGGGRRHCSRCGPSR